MDRLFTAGGGMLVVVCNLGVDKYSLFTLYTERIY